jgi:putative toxin-antitoxin system antitoxin component (TIGR02293 family)
VSESELSEVLGGEKVLGRKIRNDMDLIELSRKGVSKSALSHLAKSLGLSTAAMAQMLPITERTIQRYRAKTLFKPSVSEHILELAGLVARGTEVFGERDLFLKWMQRPTRALGNRTPRELLDSTFGVGMVMNELGRIEHGIVS